MNGSSNRRGLGRGLVVLVLIAAYALPMLGLSDYTMAIAVSAASFIVLSAGFNLVYGYAGLLSLAQVTFWGMGAYTSALLSTDYNWNPWATLPAAGLIALGSGVLVGYASLRLSRHAFGIVTLIFALLVQLVARDWVSLTRGAMGIPGLPILEIPWFDGQTLSLGSATSFYPAMLTWAVLVLALLYVVVHSRVGRALQAIRSNEILAASHGVNVLAYRLFAFGLSAMVSGVAGGMFVFYLSIVDPTVFDFYYTQAMLIMVILGGAGSFWPVVVAAIVFTIIPEALRLGDEMRMVLYGALLVVAMVVIPSGYGGVLQERRLARWQKAAR